MNRHTTPRERFATFLSGFGYDFTDQQLQWGWHLWLLHRQQGAAYFVRKLGEA